MNDIRSGRPDRRRLNIHPVVTYSNQLQPSLETIVGRWTGREHSVAYHQPQPMSAMRAREVMLSVALSNPPHGDVAGRRIGLRLIQDLHDTESSAAGLKTPLVCSPIPS